MTTETRNGQKDALVQYYQDADRTQLMCYGYLSDVTPDWSDFGRFQNNTFDVGVGATGYDNFRPDYVTLQVTAG